MCEALETMGYMIMNDNEFNELEKDDTSTKLNEILSNEKFNREYSFDNINYNFIDVKEINVSEDGVCDMIFENNNIDIKYLEWYSTGDWLKGMEWYKQFYSHIPYIEELAYFFVKADLKGTYKLEKYELNELKKIKRNKEKKEQQLLQEEKKLIREIKNYKKNNVIIKTGEFTLKL